jgi:hypothetical protein
VNHDVLFAAAASPALHLVYVGSGHTQLQDPVSCIGCGLCTPAGSADPAVVLAMAVRHHTAFFARVLLDDNSVGELLQGAGSAVDVAAGRATLESK